jgi:hypothetical protein
MAGLPASASAATTPSHTAVGGVFGDEGGSVLLWWGATCDLLNPQTTQKITS